MGIRSGACRKLEQAFAAAFQYYFVGDPSFVRPVPAGGGSLFVAAQAVAAMVYPQVAFMCIEAQEQVAQSAVYMGELNILIDTALTERSDDYPSLLALHDDRIDKVVNLIGNVPLLKTLLNAPASGPDLRAVRQFQLYGVGKVLKELNGKEPNRLCYVLTVEIPFQPLDP